MDPAKAARILIVEDEAVVALDVEVRLRRLGYQVVGTADSYASALAQAAEVRPDLVLMDIALRDGPDGIAAAERLRAELAVPVVFVTAFADAETLERAKRVSPHGYIVKPFNERDLRATIEVALYRDGLDRALRRSHDDLLAVLDVQRTGNVLVEAAGRIVFANAAAGRILGADPGTLLDLPWPEGLRLSGDARRRVEALLRTTPARRQKVVARLPGGAPGDSVVEIEIEDDPRAPERKIFFLTDVSELHGLRRLLDEQGRFHDLVGRSEGIQRVVRLVTQVAPTDVTVLIEGETGTGKELVARAIHRLSGRGEKPFLGVNCASLNENLMESELFGHVRGAFTGAVKDRMGRFEMAEGGTLFLDEVSEIGPHLQAKLLRVVQEREYQRVGETRARKADVRILSATNRRLKDLLAGGSFRDDLYYRLNVVSIIPPPLRERKEDIPVLVDYFLDRSRDHRGGLRRRFTPLAMRVLLEYSWPGNVRELENAVERARICSRGEIIEEPALPAEIRRGGAAVPRGTGSFGDRSTRPEADRLKEALARCGGNRTETAAQLGVSRVTLWRRMKQLGIGA